MAIDVHFFGLSLFVWQQELRVLLPRAAVWDLPTPIGHKTPRPHNPHFLDREKTIPLKQHLLPGYCIELGPPSGARPTRGNLNDLVQLHVANPRMQLLDESELSNPARVAAKVILRGGGVVDVLEQAPTGAGAYKFDHGSHVLDAPSCHVRWRLNEPTLHVKITPLNASTPVIEEYDFDPNTHTERRICIGNTDTNDPLKWRCVGRNCPPGQTIRDDDFKWYYKLFDLSQTADPAVLPVPVAHCDLIGRGIRPGETGTTSTCYNGEWCPPTGC